MLLIIGTAWLFDALDVGLLSFIMPLVEGQWQLSAAQTGTLGFVSSVGMVFGAIIFGNLADRFGRKHVLLASLLLFSVGSLILAFTQNYTQFIMVRFLIGMGLGGELPVAATLVADSYKQPLRSKMLIMADSFWAIGWLLAAVLSYVLAPIIDWRGVVLLTSLAGVFALVMREHLPDTAAKLDAVKQSETATLRDVLGGRNTGRTVLLWVMWFTLMFSYYGMFMWLPSVLVMKGFTLIHSFGYTAAITVAQLPGYFCAVWLIGKFKRRLVLAFYLVGTALGAVLFGIAWSGATVLLFGCVLSFFNLGAYGLAIAFTPDQYAVGVRGTGTGIAQSVGRIGAAVGPLLIGVLVDWHWSVTTIFGLFTIALLIGAGATLCLRDEAVETTADTERSSN